MARMHSLSVVLLVSLAACPGPDDTNPTVFWLAPDAGETKMKLVDHDPGAF